MMDIATTRLRGLPRIQHWSQDCGFLRALDPLLGLVPCSSHIVMVTVSVSKGQRGMIFGSRKSELASDWTRSWREARIFRRFPAILAGG